MRLFTVVGFMPMLLLLMAGCGGGSSSSSSQAAITSGNWSLIAASQVIAGNTFIGGSLTQSGSAVSAVMHINGSSCYSIDTDVTFSGSISGSSFTLTSVSVSGQVINVTGAITSSSSLTGNYTVTGGCGSGDRGTVTGTLVPSLAGNWSGTITSISGNMTTVTASVTQQTRANTDGLFLLGGTVTFTGSPCFTSGTIQSVGPSTGTSSFVVGDVVVVTINTDDGGTVNFVAFLSNPRTATQMSGNYAIVGGGCSGDSGSGTLTKS